jgi:hypothetical protein
VLNSELRPLGAGEILDRAVTLFVRRFVPMVALLGVAIAPLMIVDAIIAPGSARVFSDFGRVLTSGGGSAAQDALSALSRDSTSSGQAVAIGVLGGAVRLLMWSAIVAYVAAVYAGGTLAVADAYRIGVRRWPAQFLIALAFIVLAVIAMIPILTAYVLSIFGVVALIALKAGMIAAIFGVLAAIAIIGAFAILFAWIYMTYQLAAVAVVTESLSPIAAIAAALRRTVSRATFWRTVLAGLIVGIVSEGAALPLVAIGSALSALTHISALYFAVLGVGSILLEGLVAAYVVVYATDVRVRREGLDLLAVSSGTPATA